MFYDAANPAVVAIRRRFGEQRTAPLKVLILYGSQTGTTRSAAEHTCQILRDDTASFGTQQLDVITAAIADFGRETENAQSVSSVARFDGLVSGGFHFLVVAISTWTDGAPPPAACDFVDFLENLRTDPRVSRTYFSALRGVAVIGFGNRTYPKFCTPALNIEKCLRHLGAHLVVPLLKIDDTEDIVSVIATWTHQFLRTATAAAAATSSCTCNTHATVPVHSCCSSPLSAMKTTTAAGTANDDVDDCSSSSSGDTQSAIGCDDDGNDVEDMAAAPNVSREMLSQRQRGQLEKEGYRLVGSHSAVKLCRWTKSQLRGRGGCYKHTFYGIASHRCMEGTPSLACANKCVFCWRHHKNPVGTSWRWNTDEPDVVFNGMCGEHHQLVKQLKGVVGVHPQRFEDSTTAIRHCALSLVGEPIMYPHLSDLLSRMHAQKISTFLVTNAQFPEQMRALRPVTQLYVSVDGATAESLKKIDRPLFGDYWDRFLSCLDIMKECPGRTVFRLTLLKQYNMEEAAQFGRLIVRGSPDFIEIKAVTYSGNSTTITMQNIPWHDEVVGYARAIMNSAPTLQETYDFAAEHRHSCCILLGHKQYCVDGVWMTWIDYDKFFELDAAGKPYTGLDYSAPTPEWALFGAPQEGFDPQETRVYTKGKKKRAPPLPA